MRRSLKLIISVVLSFVVGIALGLGVFHSVQRAAAAPTIGEITDVLNVQRSLPAPQKRAIRNSRSSVVRVMSLSEDQQVFSSATGTYLTAYGRYFVLTVNHGIQGPCELTRIEASSEFVGCVRFIRLDSASDYAIVEIEKLESRTPLKIPTDLAKAPQNFAIMTDVYYTGFPNGAGPLTLDGKIIGYMGGEFIYIRSYAWSGSSGAGVFSAGGKLMGYILALDVGQTEFGIDVLEDVVFVVPITVVRWDALRKTN